jgi:two-component system nitrate/nitrite response regulator NarL
MPQPLRNVEGTMNRGNNAPDWRAPFSGTRVLSEKVTELGRPDLRVLIVDRDSMSSDLLANALSRELHCQTLTSQPPHLLTQMGKTPIDLVVIGIDPNPTSRESFDLMRGVSQAYPDVYIVVLLNQTSRELVINSFRSGARGVFSRELPMTDFIQCIEHVGKGFIWAGVQETSALLEALKSIPAPDSFQSSNAQSLTERELQVVQCAARGMTNKTIAAELRLSEHTIKNYLFRAFEKLGVSNRVELLFHLTIRGQTFASPGVETAKDGPRVG